MLKLFTVIFINLLAGPAWGQLIEQRYLLEDEPISVPMSPYTTTTLSFPSELEGISGAGFTSDYEKKKGDYLLEYASGTSYLSIIPLAEDVPPRNLNIIYNGKTFVFVPFIAKRARESWVALNLVTRPVKNEKKGENKEVRPFVKSKTKPLSDLEKASPSRLIGLMDSTKLLSATRPEERSRLLKLMPHIEANLMPNQRMHYGAYAVSIDKVIRHGKIDALCFEISVKNLSSRDLLINPESFSVRVGASVFSQVLSDIDPKIAPQKSAKGYFVIIGNGAGKPNWLSPSNRFQVSLDLIKSDG
jgi:hypothetical protein